MSDTDDDPEYSVGTIVRIPESGNTYPVVGFEQGGGTLQLPTGPGGSTREFFRDDVEYVEDVPLSRLYYIGRGHERHEMKERELAGLTLYEVQYYRESDDHPVMGVRRSMLVLARSPVSAREYVRREVERFDGFRWDHESARVTTEKTVHRVGDDG